MDAPGFAKLSVHDGWKGRLHPYIRTFVAAQAAVPDGICWLAREMLRFFLEQAGPRDD
jgi:hypothetical protein